MGVKRRTGEEGEAAGRGHEPTKRRREACDVGEKHYTSQIDHHSILAAAGALKTERRAAKINTETKLPAGLKQGETEMDPAVKLETAAAQGHHIASHAQSSAPSRHALSGRCGASATRDPALAMGTGAASSGVWRATTISRVAAGSGWVYGWVGG